QVGPDESSRVRRANRVMRASYQGFGTKTTRLKPCQAYRLQRVTRPDRVTWRDDTGYAVLGASIIESYTAEPCNRTRQHGLSHVRGETYRELHGQAVWIKAATRPMSCRDAQKQRVKWLGRVTWKFDTA
ncbi:hypothetical protein ACLOJK_018740, partial [Asimina triloba]